MAKRQSAKARLVYGLAERWVNAALRADDSILTPGSPIWTLANVEELFARTAGNPQTSREEDFEVKFRRQLDGAKPAIYQLAAEETTVYWMITVAAKGKTKRTLVTEILSWSPAHVTVPSDVDAVFEAGLVHPGTAYATRKPMQLWFLLDFVRSFKKLAAEAQLEVLDDPWAARTLLYSLETHSAQSMREALLHVLHPDAIEAITSQEDKRKIVAAFSEFITDKSTDIDHQIAAVRAGLTPEHGANFDFYEPSIKPRWKPDDPEVPEPRVPEGPPAASDATLRGLFEFVLASYDRAKKSEPNGRASPTWQAFEQIQSLLQRHPLVQPQTTLVANAKSGRGEWSAVPWAAIFDRRETLSVKDGTYVVFLFRADMTGVYATLNQGVTEPKRRLKPKAAAMAFLHDRAVEARKLDCGELPGIGFRVDDAIDLRVGPGLGADYQVSTIAYKLYERGSVPADEAIASDLAALLRAYEHYLGRKLSVAETLPAPDPRIMPLLAQIAGALEHRGQVILYGPPGTGKTYAAMIFARWWIHQKTGRIVSEALPSDGSISQLTRVTFHPSYGYEDLVEGYRPVEVGNGSQLALRPWDGIFKRICEAADEAADEQPFLLVIDEINRGNIPRIFGELITLLEVDKRGSDVLLPQSQKPFAVPPNVFLLGTMNTADRSIRLLDAALRRRFAFIELMPDPSLLKGTAVGPLDLENFLTELNRRIAETEGRERQVGHSFFMDEGKAVTTVQAFTDRMRYEVLPLLQEYAYDDIAKLQKFLGKEIVKGNPLDIDRQIFGDPDRLVAALHHEYGRT